MSRPGPQRLRELAAALALFALGCHTAPDPPQADVLDADRARTLAMVSADPDRLTAVLHEELSYAHSSGAVDTRTSLIESLVSGRVDYRAIEPSNARVRVHGRTAIVTAVARMQVAADAEVHEIDLIYTAVYLWHSGSWRLAAYHSSPSGAAPP